MTYPFKYYERIKSLESIGFDFVRYTKFIDERSVNARNSKEV